ncbi:hypothetical protein Dimus_022973 [Dionaea muscipula]
MEGKVEVRERKESDPQPIEKLLDKGLEWKVVDPKRAGRSEGIPGNDPGETAPMLKSASEEDARWLLRARRAGRCRKAGMREKETTNDEKSWAELEDDLGKEARVRSGSGPGKAVRARSAKGPDKAARARSAKGPGKVNKGPGQGSPGKVQGWPGQGPEGTRARSPGRQGRREKVEQGIRAGYPGRVPGQGTRARSPGRASRAVSSHEFLEVRLSSFELRLANGLRPRAHGEAGNHPRRAWSWSTGFDHGSTIVDQGLRLARDLSSIFLVGEDGLAVSSGGRLRGSGDSSLVIWSSCLFSTLQSSRAVSALLVKHAPSSTTVSPLGPLRALPIGKLPTALLTGELLEISRSYEDLLCWWCLRSGLLLRMVGPVGSWTMTPRSSTSVVVSLGRAVTVVLTGLSAMSDSGVRSHSSSGLVLQSHEAACSPKQFVEAACSPSSSSKLRGGWRVRSSRKTPERNPVKMAIVTSSLLSPGI